jgi:hypothetical protein
MKLDNVIINKEPTSSDFTQNAISKALINYTFGHWSFRYAIPLIFGTLVFGLFFGFTYHLFLGILTIIGIAAFSLIYNLFFRAEKFRKKYLDFLMEKLADIAEKKLYNLKEDLLNYKHEHGAKQLDQFKLKFDVLLDILKSKFDASQLTYNRYYSIAQEVYLAGIDNLNDIVLALKAMNSIDLKYIEDRLSELKKKDPANNAVLKEVDALQRSKQSYQTQEDKINQLVAENETALTQIDEATIAISEITKSTNKEAQIDMENSMTALAELAKRSKLYSR